MPYPVKSLLQGRPFPVTISRRAPVTKALDLMVEHDFSQLPVVAEDNRPVGMITYEVIMHGMRNLYASLDDLYVRDVMFGAKLFSAEDDLFDLLEEPKRSNAVLIVDAEGRLTGIVTSDDSTEFLRGRAEDLMHIEDIEVMIKEFVLQSYMGKDGTLDEEELAQAIAKQLPDAKDSGGTKPLTFEQLTFGQYANMLVTKSRWSFFEHIFKIPRDSVRMALNNIRETRNDLAHFRSVTVKQTKQLRWCADWLARCREEYDQLRMSEAFPRLVPANDGATTLVPVADIEAKVEHRGEMGSTNVDVTDESDLTEAAEVIAEETKPSDSRYAPLADWLQSQPATIDAVKVTFDEIETIIGGELPASARNHRAWWANDEQDHPHSHQWLDVGWRTTTLNMTEGHVSFVRVQEREMAYIDFFSKLLASLRGKASFPVREASPGGTSWMICQTITSSGGMVGQFNFSFTRDKRFRVELYIDTSDYATTKAVFDRINTQMAAIEGVVGTLAWERMNNRRASRIAQYHKGSVTDGEAKLAALCDWGVDAMIAFYQTIEPIASQAFEVVLQP